MSASLSSRGLEVSIRTGHAGDLEAINRIYNHYVETSHVTFDVEPYSMAQRHEWFAGFAERGRHQLFVAHRGDVFTGFVHSRPFRAKAAYATSVETTVYLDPDAVRGGVGTALYTRLLDALAREDVHRAYAGIALPNPASVALHERLGFQDAGTYTEVGRKFGRYWSVCWYERAIGAG